MMRTWAAGWRTWLVRVVLALAALALAAPSVTAQAPERERQFGYGFYAYTGSEYATGFVPPAIDTIYVLAEHESVLDPKWTLVYFWPLTSEYRADLAALNEPVSGNLEVAQGGQVVATLPLTDYVLQVDQAARLGGETLATGAEARALRASFEQQRATYVAAMNAHAQANTEYLRRMQAQEQPPPTPPVEPPPFTLFSTDLGRGFAVTLPAGDYRIRLRDDSGAPVPGSDRRLVAIVPRRQGIGYEIVPREKWTQPERSDDPSHAIHTAPASALYLQPFETLEFNALEIARLKNPQDRQATPNRWVWTPVAPIEGGTLLVTGDGTEERLSPASFVVEQEPGPALGYVVRPVDGGDATQRVDLRDYLPVTAPSGRAVLRLHLLDAAGQPLAGSGRDLIVTPATPDWLLALPMAAPLVIGAVVLLWRRRRVVTARGLRPEQRQRMA